MIPKGKVTTYGAIAACIGSKQGARLVGWALNGTSKLPEILPAHRVVNRNGVLTGKQYFMGTSMAELLESEGIKIKENKIENFKNYFWDPMRELSI